MSFTIEAICATDMKDGEMKEVDIGEGKALLIKEKGKFSAIAHKCTHYGAPLVKGVLKNGQVRCPWHGACFNSTTGDIEDFPGLDNLQCYSVKEEAGKVFITATKQQLENHKRTKVFRTQHNGEDTILVIGGGAASVTCAETLRQENFSGKITILTKEKHLPYDRPKLSKAMEVSAESILLRDQDFYSKHKIDVKLNCEVKKINALNNCVITANGNTIKYNKLLIATGGAPRTLPIPGWGLKNVHVLRTPDDANLIASKAVGKHIVVIGASFIGMEVAASLLKSAASVTVCEYFSTTFERVLGKEVGQMIQKWNEEKGIKFYMNASVTELKGENGVLKQVILQNGKILNAELAIAGIGVSPATEFMKDSGINMDASGFVKVNKSLQTNIPNIYAAGDITLFPLKMNNWEESNIQHWQMALYHGHVAGKNIMGKQVELNSVPFFWSVLFGKSIRYAGYGRKYNKVKVVGTMADGNFCAYYLNDKNVVAVATYMTDPKAAEIASKFKAGVAITEKDI